VPPIDTGMRLGEMLSLNWGQVDLRQGEVTVTAEKAKGKRSAGKARGASPRPWRILPPDPQSGVECPQPLGR